MKMRRFAALMLALATAQFAAAEELDTYYSWGNNADALPSAAGSAPGLTGSGGSYTITAAGTDIWSPTDHGAGAFDSTSPGQSGDFSAVVQYSIGLPGEEGNLPANWGRGGIMARVDPAADNSANVASIQRFGTDDGANAHIIQYRPAAGADTARPNDGFPTGGDEATPIWLGLHRANGNYYSSWSADGVTWGPGLGSVSSEELSGTVQLGLFHQNHGSGAAAHPNSTTGIFSDFSVGAFDPNLGEFPLAISRSLKVQDGKLAGQLFGREAGVGPQQATSWSLSQLGDTVEQAGLLATSYLRGNDGTDWLPGPGVGGLVQYEGPFRGIGALPNISWSGNGDVAGLDKYPDVLNLPQDPDNGGNGNQENYSVALTGQINIPAPGTYKFKDGIDDYTKLTIDGETLVDDNTWTGPTGADNGGSPIVEKTFDEAGWYDFEFRMAEGGGGDAGVLYWDYSADGPGTNAAFPAAITDAAGVDAIVPAENFRHFAPNVVGQISGDSVVDGVFVGDGGEMLSAAAGDVFIMTVGDDSFLVSAVPEPGSLSLIGMALLGLLGLRRRR